MSRIGKNPVNIPQGVSVTAEGRLLTVKGPKGELSWEHPAGVSVRVQDGRALVERSTDAPRERAFHGLVRAILQNMVTGVSDGFTRVLEVVGVGYRAQVQGETLQLSLGYARPMEFRLPPGVSAEVDKKQTTITLSGIDNQVLGQASADIRALRPPDPYKGKGVRRRGERVRLKPGKAAK
jgi:large subunit ribosomal protein L6